MIRKMRTFKRTFFRDAMMCFPGYVEAWCLGETTIAVAAAFIVGVWSGLCGEEG
jgi:hypothetical protein